MQTKEIESYLAIPLFDSAANSIGHMGVMHHEPMLGSVPRESISRAFAARAGAELERQRTIELLEKSECQAREQLAQLELLYDEAPRGLCYMGTNLRFWRCNERLADISGIAVADHFGRTLREIVPEIAESMESVYRKVIESGEAVIDVVATGATPADPQKPRHFSACYYPTKSKDGLVVGVSSIVQDITEALQRKAESAHSARLITLGEMAAGIVHELNQPLAAIISRAEACTIRLRSTHTNADKIRQNFQEVVTEAQRAGDIILRLKTLARRRKPVRSKVDLNQLVRDTAALEASEITLCAIRIQLELCESLEPISADSVQIQQVILNLLRNAIEALCAVDEQERIVTITTLPSADRGVELSMHGAGPGMCPADFGRVFDSFFSTKSEGIGIGLAIIRSIIEAHGGRLWIDPAVERGTTFRLRIPVDAGVSHEC